jgi:hypothetical protein
MRVTRGWSLVDAAALAVLTLPVISVHALDAPLTANLTVDPPRIIQGLPVAFSVLIENISDRPVSVARNVSLEVTDASGDTFSPRWGFGNETSNVGAFAADEWTVIEPHARRELAVPLDISLTSPGWFFDPRLSRPGSYRLTLRLEYRGESDDEISVLRSSDAHLRIVVPSGPDARVWTAMSALTKRHYWSSDDWMKHGFAIAKVVADCCRDSAYFPYVAGLVPASDPDVKIAMMRKGIAASPEGPMSDVLRIGIGTLLTEQAVHLAGEQQVKEALAKASLARATFDDVIRRDKPGYSALARRRMVDVPTEDWLVDWSQARKRK